MSMEIAHRPCADTTLPNCLAPPYPKAEGGQGSDGFKAGGLLGRVALAVVTLIVGAFLALTPAVAVQPDEVLPDATLEARARAMSANLRCLVCQNQSIDDSNAPLARDLRLLVRERLTAGDSDPAVMKYVVARYGEYVLLKPPVNASTVLLWLGPAAMLLLTLFFLLLKVRRDRLIREAKVEPLSAVEKDRLAAMLKDATK
jgi:cytochrome c-type biogenesis protein CcmH